MKRPLNHVRQAKPMTVVRFSRSMLLGMAVLSIGMHANASGETAAVAPSAQAKAQAKAVLVKVDDAWVRATVKGQTASGGFMSLTASEDLTLVGFTTPAAGETELHEMVMDNGVMRMRGVDQLHLPAGQTVTLKPGAGGHHLMLIDLKKQLAEGQEIVLTLKLRTAAGKLTRQDVKVPVKAGLKAAPPRSMGAASSAPGHTGHDHQTGE